jgi:hypothetical protein
MGRGRMLKLYGSAIEEVNNGSDGVLFATSRHMAPWNL